MTRLLTMLTLTIIYSQVSGQMTDSKYRDNSVNKIKLRDPKTVEQVIGDGVTCWDKDDDEKHVVNADGKQLLTLIFHPGGTINEFCEFKVSYNTASSKAKCKIQTKGFVTGKKIKLGLTEKQLEKLLGSPSKKETEGGVTIWRYETGIEDDLYFGRYDFKDGRLIQFWFGERYP